MKTLPELVLMVVAKLWWMPLPFAVGKIAVHFARKWNRYRNMR